MKLLLANRLFPAILFPPREPGQFAPNWFRLGSNGKGNHVEAPFAKPPPVAVWKGPQVAVAQSRSWPLAEYGVARTAADDVGHAAAEHLVSAKRGREAAIENLRI